MLIRVRSKDGNFRFDLQPTSDISELLDKILETSQNADLSTVTISNNPKGGEHKILSLKGKNLQTLGFKHGDLLFVNYQAASAETPNGAGQAESSSQSNSDASKRPWDSVEEDPVDIFWRKQDGKIPRGRDSRLCKHGPNAMCDHCMPLEPYDPTYHSDNSIKHLSYHAYLRKLTPQTSSTSSTSLSPLSSLSYKVKTPCPNASHAPWPEGICTACQPSAITLQPQPFRMVDHLEFSSESMVDRFLHAWRVTGAQRFGWLVGRYAPYEKVPMGIKAVVEAIHEPSQEGELDGLSLGLPWDDEPRIRALAATFSPPLTLVGYIFTDLTPSEEDRTKSVYKRHAQSFFLSSLEVDFAARLQLANPTASKSSPTGQFSSRLVTAVATATEDGGIDISAYQVSEQACAMVDADMIEPSVDPSIMRVKEEDRTPGSARYVPDVFFRFKNEYGLEVKKSAKPAFPVEYLLVNVTHGFPQNPSPLFRSHTFAIENRPGLENQDVQNILKALLRIRAPDTEVLPGGKLENVTGGNELLSYLCDWHFIVFLSSTQLFSEGDLKLLIRAISESQAGDTSSWSQLIQTDSWHSLMTFTRESAPSKQVSKDTFDDLPQDIRDQIAQMEGGSTAMDVGDASASHGVKVCPHCTFENPQGNLDCEVCGLPLG